MRALPMLRALRALQAADEALAARAEEETRHGLAVSLAEGAKRAERVMDETVSEAIERGASVECAAGCSSCCHVHVEVTQAEVLAIALHLRSERTDDERTTLTRALADRVARTSELDAGARWEAQVPCALLARDGRCSIYAARPLRCRAFHSSSAERCRHADTELPIVRSLERATDAVERGFDRALEAASASAVPLLLEPALLKALVPETR